MDQPVACFGYMTAMYSMSHTWMLEQDPKSLHQLNEDVVTLLDTSSQLHKSSHQVKFTDAVLLAVFPYEPQLVTDLRTVNAD